MKEINFLIKGSNQSLPIKKGTISFNFLEEQYKTQTVLFPVQMLLNYKSDHFILSSDW